MATFPAPPTYADVVLIDERAAATGKPSRPKFNPIWLKWFLDLGAFVSSSGGGGGTAANHESLTGLLGGAANDHYHLTGTQQSYAIGSYGSAPSAITVTASPFAYQNAGSYNASVLVQGGTVTKVEFSRNGSTYYDVGTVAGMFQLSPSDYLKVTYTVAPTMTRIVR
jgi:hypothetical protein